MKWSWMIKTTQGVSNHQDQALYEKHVLLESSQIYYWIYKCTTCHHYTNIIKKSLIKLIKTKSLFTTVEGTSLILSVARDSAWRLA